MCVCIYTLSYHFISLVKHGFSALVYTALLSEMENSKESKRDAEVKKGTKASLKDTARISCSDIKGHVELLTRE